MPPLSPADFYAFDELRRRKAAIRTPQDQQRYDLDVWRMANEPGFQERMAQIGQKGRFMSGPFEDIDYKAAAPLALSMLIPGAGIGGGLARTLLGPAKSVLRKLGGGALGTLGAGRLQEGIGRLADDRPGATSETLWGAADVVPGLFGLRRLLGGGRQVAGPAEAAAKEAASTPALLDARKIDAAMPVTTTPGVASGAVDGLPRSLFYRDTPATGVASGVGSGVPTGAGLISDPAFMRGFLGRKRYNNLKARLEQMEGPSKTPTGVVDDAASAATDAGIAAQVASQAAPPGVVGSASKWGVNGFRGAIQDTNHILEGTINHQKLGLIDDDIAKAIQAGDRQAKLKASGYGPEAEAYLKELGLSDKLFEVSPGFKISEVQWVLNGRKSLNDGGVRKWLDGTDHQYPSLGKYFKNNELPYELQAHMDRIGLNYFRTHRTLNKLGIDSKALGTTDAHVKEWYEKLGRRLGEHHTRLKERLQAGKITEKQFVDELNKTVELACSNCNVEAKKIGDSLDEVQKRLRMLPIMGALVGGTLGYNQEDDEDTALLNAAAGAIAGGAGAGMLGSILRSKGATAKYQTWVFWSLLGRPAPAARANLGALGGTAVGAVERAVEGIFGGSPQKIAQGLGILGDLPVKYPRMWTKNILMNPAALQQRRAALVGTGLEDTSRLTPEAIRATGRLSNVYGAGDVTAVEIMTRHGMTADEALRLTLTGRPSTKRGTDILEFLSTKPGEEGIVPMLKTTLSPFPRVSVIGAEEALKRVPGLGIAQYLTGRGGGLKPASMPQALARSVTGLGTIKAGEAAYDQLPTQGGPDPRVLEVAKGAVGPGQGLFEGTRNFIRARQEGQGLPGAMLKTAAEAVSGQQPLGFRPASLLTSPVTELQRRMVPGVIGDIARGVDPAYGRETRPDRLQSAALRGEIPAFMSPLSPTGDIASRLGPLFAQIPWLSQKTLPPQFAPVTLTGKPRFTTPEAQILSQSAAERGAPVSATKRLLSRSLFPTTQAATPPPADYRDPQLNLLRRAGLSAALEPPRAQVNLPGGMGRLMKTPESAAAIQEQRGVPNEVLLRLLTQSPQLQQLLQTPMGLSMLTQIIGGLRRGMTPPSGDLAGMALQRGAKFPSALLGGLPW